MDKIRCLINMSIAFFLYPFAKGKFKGRKIWIVGGNAGELFVDNGRAIYEYIRAKKEVEEYWVINRNSPAFKKIPGKKLLKGSVKSYLYFMNAQVVLFSHSISADIVPYLYVVPIIRKFHYKTLKVFLNHGTVGFKVRMAMNKKTEKIAEEMVRSYDVNICDSQYEKEIKRDKWWNIPEEKIFITLNKHKEEDEMVQKFLEKEYGKRYNSFIIGLLHEVGHIETFEEDLDEERDLVYGLLKIDFNNGNSDIEKFNNMYFRIPAEYNATAWAINYYETHLQECQELAKKLNIDF